MTNQKFQFDSKFWQPQLQLVAKLGSWVAFPVIIGAWLGKWLDKKYDTEPWLFLVTVGLAFLISMFGLIVNAMKEYQKIVNHSNNSTKPASPEISSQELTKK